MLLAWIILVFLSFIDIWTTYEALERGGTEANPISGWLIDNEILVEGKILILSLIWLFCFLANRSGKKNRLIRGIWIVNGVYIFVVSWNFMQLVR